MSASSFLFGGNPPSAVNQTTSDTAQLPAWYQTYLEGLMGTANTIAAQPYPQYSGPRVADFNPTQQSAFQMVGNLPNATSGMLNNASNSLSNASNVNVQNAVAPYAAASTGYNPLLTAQPYLDSTSGYMNASANAMTPQNLQNWMSPYTNNVVQGLTNTANQNWNQTIMPSIQDAFTSAGQYGSGRNAQILGQAANQFQTNLEGQVSNALQSGYNTAGTLAGQQAGVLGQLGNLGLGQASTAAGAAGSEAGILQGAGQLSGTAAQQQGALNLGQTSAAGTLAEIQQQIALQNAAAQQQVGTQQQNLSQQNLDTAYQDFVNQAMWPQQQADFMSSIIRGLPTPGTSTTVSSNSQPNPLSQNSPSFVGSLGSLIAGSGSNAMPSFTFAKGGHVKKRHGALSQHKPRMSPDIAALIMKLATTPAPKMGARPVRPMPAAPAPQGTPPGGNMSPTDAQSVLKLATTPAQAVPHMRNGGILTQYPPMKVQHVGLPQGALHYAHIMGSPKGRGALSYRRP